MKKVLFIALVAIFALSSCGEEEEVKPTEFKDIISMKIYLKNGKAPDGRVYLFDASVNEFPQFTDNDLIKFISGVLKDKNGKDVKFKAVKFLSQSDGHSYCNIGLTDSFGDITGQKRVLVGVLLQAHQNSYRFSYTYVTWKKGESINLSKTFETASGNCLENW